jgi:hypothetical protein
MFAKGHPITRKLIWGAVQKRTDGERCGASDRPMADKGFKQQGKFNMAGIPSVHDIEFMSQDQLEIILHSSAKALAADPTNVEHRATFSLVNDHAVCKWLSAVARRK